MLREAVSSLIAIVLAYFRVMVLSSTRSFLWVCSFAADKPITNHCVQLIHEVTVLGELAELRDEYGDRLSGVANSGVEFEVLNNH